MEDGSLIPVVLLGNKCDLEASEVPVDALDQFCADHNFVGWLETSAKANVNVQEARVSPTPTHSTHVDAHLIVSTRPCVCYIGHHHHHHHQHHSILR